MQYPLDFRFKLIAFSSQIAVRDALGGLRCYVKQKSFKLKEDIVVFADEAQTTPLYRIRADRVIDFSAQYTITDPAGRTVGLVRRRGMRSLWRVSYEIERDGQPLFAIQEDNPWVKVADGLFSQIPLVGALAGYLFHPAYRVMRAATGDQALRVVKRPALFEGRFQLDKLVPLPEADEQLGIIAVVVMLLLERRRG